MMGRLINLRIVNPILDLLRQGITPEKIALSITLGLALGVIPVLGATSILCLLAAVLLRLNLPAIQLVNYIVYPLQFALLVPFIRMGQWIFADRATKISAAQIVHMIRANTLAAIASLWTATMHALVAWLAVCSILVPILYLFLSAALRRIDQSPEVVTG